MIFAYIIGAIVVCWVGWFILKFLVGGAALQSNPISAGQTYIKKTLQTNSVINARLVPDEAYKQIASLAYNMADISHAMEKKHLTDVYMSNLDLFVQQIEIIMTGHGTDLESNITNILTKHGVPIPKRSVNG